MRLVARLRWLGAMMPFPPPGRHAALPVRDMVFFPVLCSPGGWRPFNYLTSPMPDVQLGGPRPLLHSQRGGCCPGAASGASGQAFKIQLVCASVCCRDGSDHGGPMLWLLIPPQSTRWCCILPALLPSFRVVSFALGSGGCPCQRLG